MITGRLLERRRNDRFLVDVLYRRIVGRPPSEEEQRLAVQTLDEARRVRRRLAGLKAKTKTVGGDRGPWEDLCMALLCSNEFIYVD